MQHKLAKPKVWKASSRRAQGPERNTQNNSRKSENQALKRYSNTQSNVYRIKFNQIQTHAFDIFAQVGIS